MGQNFGTPVPDAILTATSPQGTREKTTLEAFLKKLMRMVPPLKPPNSWQMEVHLFILCI